MPTPDPVSVAPRQSWQWTAKAGALAAAVILTLLGLLAIAWRKSPAVTATGLVCLLAGAALLWYASTIAAWCTPPNRAFGTAAWGGAFWHEPTLRDCLRLTR